ncbi:MAG: cytochrome P450 [Parachlamydiales bacterium]
MSLFNAIYTFSSCRLTQPIQEEAVVSIEINNQNITTRWLKWMVSLPIRFMHGTYNELSLIYYRSINEVVTKQIYSGNSINALQFLFNKNGHILSSKWAISALSKHYRNDPSGYFETDEDNAFLHLLRDLCPGVAVDRNSFLLTCSKDHVRSYKRPLLDYIKESQIHQLRPKIDDVVTLVLDAYAEKGSFSAKRFAETYTVAVLARVFLSHPGTMDDFQQIGKGASFAASYQFIKKWGRPSEKHIQRYNSALDTLRSAISQSSGDFIVALEKKDFSKIQLAGMLMLIYLAGSETTSSALQYILWRLGQNPKLQEIIRKDNASLSSERESKLNSFIADCFSNYTSVPFFSRTASKDIVFMVEHDGTSWEYPISKGETIIAAPLLAGSSIFNENVHFCPGQWLAKAEISRMIGALLSRYEIESFPKKNELSTIPGHSFLRVEPVELTLKKI